MFCGFLILQREWGIAALLFFVYLTYLYIFGCNYRLLAINAISASMLGFLGYLKLHHIQVRINAWLNPWQDIANVGYQITQSLFAIASGGLLGTGLGMGRPEFIPEVQTDFIFSAICEEMGVLGGIAVILLFFIFIYRGFKISLSTRQPFHKILSIGITLLFAYQTFMILGGVTGLIPLTGITLPFISYGGSSMITNFISLGLLQAISNKV
jgi:cell division protein FtsW (lipid II flippase)